MLKSKLLPAVIKISPFGIKIFERTTRLEKSNANALGILDPGFTKKKKKKKLNSKVSKQNQSRSF